MKITFHKGIQGEKDLEEINNLDKLTYSEKYLLDIDEYKKRLKKNSNQIYLVRNSKRNVIGYISLIPLRYKEYIRLKNGEVDKEVITIDSIIGENEKIENIYLDSIIVDPSYRKQKIGKKLMNYSIKDILKNNPEIKRILAHTISKGGLKVTEKYGLRKKRKLDETTVVVEKVLSRKSTNKKRIYRNNDKREIMKKEKNINLYTDLY